MSDKLETSFYKEACENVPYGVAAIDADGRFIWVNYFFTLLTGYSEAELKDRTWMEITDIQDIGPNALEVQRILNGDSDHYTLQKKYVQKGGKKIPVILHIYKYPDKGDFVLFLVFVGANGNSDMYVKNLEEQLSLMQNKIDTIMSQIDNPAELIIKAVRTYWWLITAIGTVASAIISWIINILT